MEGIQRAVFLDLQGTLGGEGLDHIMGFSFYQTAARAVGLVNDAGLLAIVITNQSHISKGLFTMQDFERKMAELKAELAVDGARVDAVYCCPHSTKDGCECRKPLPGMLLKARADFDIDLCRSYVVGDAGAWDMALARKVGSKAVLVRTGLGESSLCEYRHTWRDIEPDHIAEDVLRGVEWIITQEGASEQAAGGDAEDGAPQP